MATTRPLMGYQAVTIPCDSGDSAFLVERRSNLGIAVRINKVVLFFTLSEARQVTAALIKLLGPDSGELR